MPHFDPNDFIEPPQPEGSYSVPPNGSPAPAPSYQQPQYAPQPAPRAPRPVLQATPSYNQGPSQPQPQQYSQPRPAQVPQPAYQQPRPTQATAPQQTQGYQPRGGGYPPRQGGGNFPPTDGYVREYPTKSGGTSLFITFTQDAPPELQAYTINVNFMKQPKGNMVGYAKVSASKPRQGMQKLGNLRR